MTPEQIVAYLEKNGRSTVKDIGTDNATMYALEKAGAVEKDGSIRVDGAGRGRPPTAWIVANGEKAAQVEAPGTKGRGGPEQIKKMHEGKEKARQDREKAELKSKQKELKELKSTNLLPAYEKALDKALKTDKNQHWQVATQLQNQIISNGSRMRALESELA